MKNEKNLVVADSLAEVLEIGEASAPVVTESTVTEGAAEAAAPAIEIIKPGKKGVTNAQMIPALRESIDAGDTDKLALIKQTFPQVYESSVKYLSKDHKAKLEAFGI
jgi:hypothetical protein